MNAKERELKEKALFVVCKTKEHLQSWLQVYFNIDLPSYTVDPTSNSNPMDLVWEVYSEALAGDESFTQILAYAARGTFKTLGAAIIESLCLLHLNKDIGHLAAIQSQSSKAQSYINKFFNMPIIRDYVTKRNERRIEITRYFDDNGESISPVAWALLPDDKQREYTPETHYLQIIIATLQGANCVDPATEITLADGSLKQAHSILPGEEVRSFDISKQEWTVQKIGSVSSTIKQSMRVTFNDGTKIVLSEDHPIFTESGWMTTRSLRLGTKCFGTSSGSTPITNETPMVDMSPPCIKPWSALLGSLLGDSSLTWPTSPKKVKYGRGPRFQVSHCLAQNQYLLRKQEILTVLGIQSKQWTGNGGYGVTTKIMSRTDSRFVELYNLLYGSGKKTITKEVLDLMDDEALAFWIMDDGSGNALKVGSAKKEKRIEIATCSFSIEENQLLCDWFKNRYNFDVKIRTTSNSAGKIYPILSLSLTDSRKLSEIIGPYMSPCMRYKLLLPESWRTTRCIDCGETIEQVNRLGFSGCLLHPRSKGRLGRGQKQFRETNQKFKARMNATVTNLEFVGLRSLVDLHIETDNEQVRNFQANRLILLHNSEHVPFLCLDELDVVANHKVIDEAKLIPTPDINGNLPITFLTSSRKFSYGLVQKEIDNAAKSGMHIRHWNVIDCTRACPPSRHKPELPKVPIYVDENNLVSLSVEKWKELPNDAKINFVETKGFAGCSSCELHAMCMGRLATEQKSTSKMLKSIPAVIDNFKAVSLDVAKAQLLCLKPSTEGLIYPHFDPTVHVITASEMAQKITGEIIKGTLVRSELISLMKTLTPEFYSGADFGYTHNFAVVTGWVWNNILYIIDVISIPGLEVMEKIELMNNRIKYLNPIMYADPENPSEIKTFRKHGYDCRDFQKDVLSGINAVRTKIRPNLGVAPQLFILKDMPGAEILVKELSQYHWKTDSGGNPTDQPEKIDDDLTDSLRYLVQNLFATRNKVLVAGTEMDQDLTQGHEYTINNWMSKTIAERTDDSSNDSVKIKKGGSNFSF